MSFSSRMLTRVARRWAREEMASWMGCDLTTGAIERAVDEATQRNAVLFRYDLVDGRATFQENNLESLGEQKGSIIGRAQAYCELLTRSVKLAELSMPITLAVYLGDVPPSDEALPIFSFQKPMGSSCLLLPDVDLLALTFLSGPEFDDEEPFRMKADHAIFVGSTTGGHITLESAKALTIPRLRAAMFFKNEPRVTFVLPNVVQFADAETHDYLVGLDLGRGRIEWKEQARCKYLLSMDGNGATCSRVAAALKCNGVLLKYDSPYQLFYFKGLKPWRHFVPIQSDVDVLDLLALADREQRKLSSAARRGAKFYKKYLNMQFCDLYTAELLKLYSSTVVTSSS